MAAKPRRVDFLNELSDFRALVLAHLGLSAAYILDQTDLESVYQVRYRLHKAGVKITDYRNGQSPYHRVVTRAIEPVVAGKLRAALRAGAAKRRAVAAR